MFKNTLTFLVAMIAIQQTQQQRCIWGNTPVCGVDNVTYPNQCALQAAYVQLKHIGTCTKIFNQETGEVQSNCDQTYLPVCGRDGVTYLNECTLQFNEVTMAYSGPCDHKNYTPHNPPLQCRCRGEKFQPVCSFAGYTYENECVLNCTQQISSGKGPCATPCNCPQLYRPVCGVDGRTYDNNCSMECVGVVKQANGECPSIQQGCQFCSKVFMPACGQDGITYRNLCEMKCNNAQFEGFGVCEKKKDNRRNCSQCPNVQAPICGTDGVQYDNECLCTCKGTCRKYSDGACPKEKSCARCAGVLAPTCSKKGITYDNQCYLQCAQDEFLKDGPCDFSLDQSVPQTFADYSKLEEFFKQYQSNF